MSFVNNKVLEYENSNVLDNIIYNYLNICQKLTLIIN